MDSPNALRKNRIREFAFDVMKNGYSIDMIPKAYRKEVEEYLNSGQG